MISITIIIVAYNNESTITQTIESLKMIVGSFRKEIIIFNDGSTDNTLQTIKAITIDLPKTTIISEQNRGSSTCIANGIAMSTGEFICLLQGNEILHPIAIKSLLTTMEQMNVDLALGFKKIGFSKSFKDFSIASSKLEIINDPIYEILSVKDSYSREVAYGGALIKKSLLNKIQAEDIELGSYSADFSLSLKCAKYTKFALLNEEICFKVPEAKVQSTKAIDKKFYVYNVLQSIAKFINNNPEIVGRYKGDFYKFLYKMIWSLDRTKLSKAFNIIASHYISNGKDFDSIKVLYEGEIRSLR